MLENSLLMRQLKRLGLKPNSLPTQSQWEEFLDKIARTYNDVDQERYLHELAIDVSGRETSSLNRKLEKAQELANLGYWSYDREKDIMSWSKEMYRIFNIDPLIGVPTYSDIMKLFHESDRIQIEKNLTNYYATQNGFHMEARIFPVGQNTIKWLHITATQPSTTKENKIVSGIVMDITDRKCNEEKLKALNDELIESAHKSGMAEIATNVLHHIGNILNSLNVSKELISESVDGIELKKFNDALVLVENNLHNIQEYLQHDEVGKIMLPFLKSSALDVTTKKDYIKAELTRMSEILDRLKAIVTAHSELTDFTPVKEEFDIDKLIEKVVRNNMESILKETTIAVQMNLQAREVITNDKNKIIQIISALIYNAIDSLNICPSTQIKQIHIKTEVVSNQINIIVNDNGTGIEKDKMYDVFSFIKATHQSRGLSLHNSALIAKELGGSLSVQSEGINLGATFTFTLPIN